MYGSPLRICTLLTERQVFEPSEIRAQFLTEDDTLIRAQDIPERIQLTSPMFSDGPVLAPIISFGPTDISEAAGWVTPRLSPRKNLDYFSPSGQHQKLQTELVSAITFVLRQLFIENTEVPYIWTHKRDHITYFDDSFRYRHELLSLDELWRIYVLGQKYRSLLERRRGLTEAYVRFNCTDSYYEEEIVPRIESVEVVADTSEWLLMKYKDKKQDDVQFRFHDDEEPQEIVKKRKMPSRISAYEVAKKSVVAKLAQVSSFGLLTISISTSLGFWYPTT